MESPAAVPRRVPVMDFWIESLSLMVVEYYRTKSRIERKCSCRISNLCGMSRKTYYCQSVQGMY